MCNKCTTSPNPYDIRTDTFMGKPLHELATIAHMMDSMGVSSAREFETKYLGPKRLDVFDSENQRRLLGTLARPCHDIGRHDHFNVMSHLSVRQWGGMAPSPSPNMASYATFRRIVKASNWDAEWYLVTATPLPILLRTQGFKLPGETDRAADHRLYYA